MSHDVQLFIVKKLQDSKWAKAAAAGLVGISLGFILGHRFRRQKQQKQIAPRISGSLLGIDDNSEQVHQCTLSNDAGDFHVTLSSLGCAITSVVVNGKDIVLVSVRCACCIDGFLCENRPLFSLSLSLSLSLSPHNLHTHTYAHTKKGYDNNLEAFKKGGKQNFGTIVGRCVNRIKEGSFAIGSKQFQLAANNGKNHLHGDSSGYFSKNFRLCETAITCDATCIKLSYHSKDGEEGCVCFKI